MAAQCSCEPSGSSRVFYDPTSKVTGCHICCTTPWPKQSEARVRTRGGATPPCQWEECQRICGHGKATTAPLQCPSSLVISDVFRNDDVFITTHRSQGKSRPAHLIFALSVSLGFLYNHIPAVSWFLQSWGRGVELPVTSARGTHTADDMPMLTGERAHTAFGK